MITGTRILDHAGATYQGFKGLWRLQKHLMSGKYAEGTLGNIIHF